MFIDKGCEFDCIKQPAPPFLPPSHTHSPRPSSSAAPPRRRPGRQPNPRSTDWREYQAQTFYRLEVQKFIFVCNLK